MFNFQNKFRIITSCYFLLIAFLFLYSFTQVDLSLTLSRVSVVQSLEKWFQQIGYFDRPLSTGIYIGIILLLFFFYVVFFKLSKKLNIKQIWILIFGTAILLLLSYNALSYDLFNYVFDAKIITHYHLNPYDHKALDFPLDPMLSFMHWTQRTYPYGPFWLTLTVPLSFLGFGFFIPTLILFKALMVGAYFGSCHFLYKIFKKISGEHALQGLVLFALNPLVIIESLVSAHLDIVMIFFSLLAIYFFVLNKKVSSFASLLVSAGVKFATGLLLPLFVAKQISKKFSWELFFSSSLFLMLFTVVAASIRTNFQPWYYLVAIPFAAFFSRKVYITVPLFILSACALFEYVPFLFNGNWNPPIPMLLQQLRVFGIGLSAVIVFFFYSLRRK